MFKKIKTNTTLLKIIFVVKGLDNETCKGIIFRKKYFHKNLIFIHFITSFVSTPSDALKSMLI